jgi:non-heme chloroperoxidase
VLKSRSSGFVLSMICFVAFLAAPQLRATGTPSESKASPVERIADIGDVRLQFVDWGGKGPVVLFLAGFGNDAHVFDTFAPLFTASFHAIGLTRRGFGRSDKPAGGYDLATRTHDIAALLDALDIRVVDIIGHSMAGDEMTLFASQYPDRVDRLVYLDAAYDHSRTLDLMLEDPGTPPLFQRLILEARGSAKADTIKVPDMPSPADWNVLVQTIRSLSAYHIDYSRVKAPALAIYANPGRYPDIEGGTPASQRREMERWWAQRQRPSDLANIERFRSQAVNGKVIELKGAKHYLFTGSTQASVAEEVRVFLEPRNPISERSRVGEKALASAGSRRSHP